MSWHRLSKASRLTFPGSKPGRLAYTYVRPPAFVLRPYLALLGASVVAVGLVTGFGELIGYGLRLVSGRWAGRTGHFLADHDLWLLVQMFAEPALVLTGKTNDFKSGVLYARSHSFDRHERRTRVRKQCFANLGGFCERAAFLRTIQRIS